MNSITIWVNHDGKDVIHLDNIFEEPTTPSNSVIIFAPVGRGEEFCRKYFTDKPIIKTNPVGDLKTLY